MAHIKDLSQFPKWNRVLNNLFTIKPMEGKDKSAEQTLALIKEAQAYYAHLRYIPDTTDKWLTPREFVTQGGGDCEDFAIARMFYLFEKGVPLGALRLALGYTPQRVFHCVCECAVNFGDDTFAEYGSYRLDNLHEFAQEVKLHNRYFKPLFYLDTEGYEMAGV